MRGSCYTMDPPQAAQSWAMCAVEAHSERSHMPKVARRPNCMFMLSVAYPSSLSGRDVRRVDAPLRAIRTALGLAADSLVAAAYVLIVQFCSLGSISR
jgi:hypothetical protein